MTSPKAQHTRATLIIHSGVVVLFLCFAFFEISKRYYGSNSLDTIVITHPATVSFLRWVVLAVAAILLMVSCVSFKRKVLRWPGAGVVIAIAFYPACGLIHTMKNLPSWTALSSVVADDRQRYTFLDRSMMQDRTMAIGQITHEGIFTTTYRVLVSTQGDAPHSWASIIRPSTAINDYGQLYLADNQFLVGVRFANHCYLAYDLKTGTSYRGVKVETLSPFISLSAGEQPKEADIQATCQEIQAHLDNYALDFFLEGEGVRVREGSYSNSQQMPGSPMLSVLRKDAQSDKPIVAEVAQRLLACAGAGIAQREASEADKADKAPKTK